jgi:hypothetical protein
MSNKHHIDKILKESFDNFSPEAPDVWQVVQQGVQAAQVAGAATSGSALVVAKSASLWVKVSAGIAIGAAVVSGYVLYQERLPSEKAGTLQAITSQEMVSSNEENLIENQLPKMEAEMIQEKNIEQVSSVKKPKHHHTNKQSVKVTKPFIYNDLPPTLQIGNPTVEPESSLKPIVEKEIKQVSNEGAKPAKQAASHAAKKIEETKQKTQPPYNPYAEDGEMNESPVIPGSISPNNDGLNDKFEISIENEIYYQLRIMNEKAELVFESRDKDQVWDGRNYRTGVMCSTGTYLYFFNYQFKGSDKMREKSGLLRLF